jgi:hypothetical protein
MDEYISKDAVLKAFKLTANNPNKDYQRGIQDTIDCLVPEVIADIPTADVQPVVHGKWDTHDVVKVLCSGKTLDGFCQCEACGDVFPLAYSEYNYCPNCGARMDLKEGDAE